jgi:hypothetical protein
MLKLSFLHGPFPTSVARLRFKKHFSKKLLTKKLQKTFFTQKMACESPKYALKSSNILPTHRAKNYLAVFLALFVLNLEFSGQGRLSTLFPTMIKLTLLANFLQAMLKLTLLTMLLFSHAETHFITAPF